MHALQSWLQCALCLPIVSCPEGIKLMPLPSGTWNTAAIKVAVRVFKTSICSKTLCTGPWVMLTVTVFMLYCETTLQQDVLSMNNKLNSFVWSAMRCKILYRQQTAAAESGNAVSYACTSNEWTILLIETHFRSEYHSNSTEVIRSHQLLLQN